MGFPELASASFTGGVVFIDAPCTFGVGVEVGSIVGVGVLVGVGVAVGILVYTGCVVVWLIRGITVEFVVSGWLVAVHV